SGFTEDHLTVFKQANIKRVLIAYDRDEAGNTAAVKLAEQLQVEGFACYRLHFPKGMDANAYALEVRPANKSLGVVIRSAQWMGDGEALERDPDPETISPLAAESELQTETTESAPIAPELESVASETETPPLPAAAVPPTPE
ncbi:toprim domain-containing protein, partial [Thiolapillus sp.]